MQKQLSALLCSTVLSPLKDVTRWHCCRGHHLTKQFLEKVRLEVFFFKLCLLDIFAIHKIYYLLGRFWPLLSKRLWKTLISHWRAVQQCQEQSAAWHGLGVSLGQISLLGRWFPRPPPVKFFIKGHFMKFCALFTIRCRLMQCPADYDLNACHWICHTEMCQPQLHPCCIPGGCLTHSPSLPFGQPMMFLLKSGMVQKKFEICLTSQKSYVLQKFSTHSILAIKFQI